MARQHTAPGVTMATLARLAGVSKSTVSRALAHDPRVNERTRRRIESLAADLRFLPNAAARALAHGRTHVLGLVIPFAPRRASDPFYLEFLGGVADRATRAGYSLLLTVSETAASTPAGAGTPASSHVPQDPPGPKALPGQPQPDEALRNWDQ
ncbi:MAG: LacI family DNA-binding transcriptional regulator, partial [Firmicutes bacterium]|nr:LacI family DNA-binding transcriptional regulator [Bacillota bacterium]